MDHEDADARLLAELAGTAHGQVAEEDAARAIAEQATTLLPAAAHASITLRTSPGHHRSLGSTSTLAESADRLQYELHEGPCVEAATVGGDSWFSSGDLDTDARWPLWGQRAATLGARSVFSVQLRHRTLPFGAVNVYSEEPGEFVDPEVVTLALLWATHAAAALTAARATIGLRTAVSAQHLVGVAQGMLMHGYQLDQQAASQLLVRLATESDQRLRDIAAHIVVTRQLPPT